MVLDGILPASGAATRMRGLAKFLIPCDDEYLSLLERHIENLMRHCDSI
jgi:CTP:molybdopterin cytidylyltransferase MocA